MNINCYFSNEMDIDSPTHLLFSRLKYMYICSKTNCTIAQQRQMTGVIEAKISSYIYNSTTISKISTATPQRFIKLVASIKACIMVLQHILNNTKY